MNKIYIANKKSGQVIKITNNKAKEIRKEEIYNEHLMTNNLFYSNHDIRM